MKFIKNNNDYFIIGIISFLLFLSILCFFEKFCDICTDKINENIEKFEK